METLIHRGGTTRFRWLSGITFAALILTACSGESHPPAPGDSPGSLPGEASPTDAVPDTDAVPATEAPQPGEELPDSDRIGNGKLTVRFDVTGDASVSGEIEHGPLTYDLGETLLSCRGFAAGGKTSEELGEGFGGVRYFAFPWLDDSGGVADKFISVTIGVSGYQGPGTYTESDNLQVNPSEVGLVIDDDEFTLPPGGRTTLVINADGGGVWEFPRLESERGTTVNGTMTWTCADRT